MFVFFYTLLLCLGVGIAVWLIFTGRDEARSRMRANLQRGIGQKEVDRDSKYIDVAFIRRMAGSPARRSRYEKLLVKAGRPKSWTLEKVLSAKLLAAVCFTSVFALLTLTNPSARMFGLTIGVGVFGFFLPDLLLYNLAIKRVQAVDLELADTLDQMSIAVQAGLGFDAAMLQVAKQGKGVLSSEIVRTLQDIQVGRTRRLAYEDLTERLGSVPLRRFIRAVIQADSYGIPLSDVLSTQAVEMRRARRQEAERKAMQIPVKVVIPLILCILPALFVVIIGPAAINIMESLKDVGG